MLDLRMQLQTIFEERYKASNRTLEELSRNIGVHKSYVSKFLCGKLETPSPRLLKRVRDFVRRTSIDPADERLLVDLMQILERAKDKDALIAALVSTRGGE